MFSDAKINTILVLPMFFSFLLLIFCVECEMFFMKKSDCYFFIEKM